MDKFLIKDLLEIKALSFSTKPFFILSSGLESPIYFDNRKTLSYPNIRTEIIRNLVDLTAEKFSIKNIEAIVGIATAGIPYGTLLATEFHLPFAYVRDKKKSHGQQNIIEGVVSAGQKVLLVEDVVSTAGSALRAIEELKRNNIDVIGLISVYSHQFLSAEEKLAKLKIPFFPLLTLTELMNQGRKYKLISDEEFELMNNWKMKKQ